MLIATWNVNSIRAHLENVLGWVAEKRPDVLLLQETKGEAETFPRQAFADLGYHAHVVGQKSYNGVAILSRAEAQDVLTSLPGDITDTDARYIEATVLGVRVASLYLPNGNPLGTEKYEAKLKWMQRLKTRAKELLKQEIPFVLGGDFNVIPEAQDVYDPKAWEGDALFAPATRRAYREIVNLGLTDAFRALAPTAPRAYSFWDYQAGAWPKDQGLRIDAFLLSPEATDRLAACAIDRTPRSGEKPSDHTVVWVRLV